MGAEKMYVEAESPRVCCPKHRVVTAAVPWARHGSRFTKSFEETAAWLSVHASRSAVSEFMRVEWHTVGGICKRVYQEMEESRSSRFNGLVNIGIDETSYKKGHKYMTVVINHDKSSVIWCAPGYGKDVLSQFFELLSEEQRASIRCVSADGARWIASCVEEYAPTPSGASTPSMWFPGRQMPLIRCAVKHGLRLTSRQKTSLSASRDALQRARLRRRKSRRNP